MDLVKQLQKNAVETQARMAERQARYEASKAAAPAKPSGKQTPGRMKSTVVDESGDVRCPKCGARNSFTVKRTGKAKLIAGVATGGVGIALMPKRLKCNGCGANLRRG